MLKKKREARADADLIATFGWPPVAIRGSDIAGSLFEASARPDADDPTIRGPHGPYAIDAEGWFALWLNLGRARLQQSVAVARGVETTKGNGPLSKDWFDAVAFDESQVNPKWADVNADRAMFRAMAKKGRPG